MNGLTVKQGQLFCGLLACTTEINMLDTLELVQGLAMTGWVFTVYSIGQHVMALNGHISVNLLGG